MPSALPEGDQVPAYGSLPESALERLGGRPFGFYVHVPFCRVRCGYCDFNTYTAEELGGGVSRTSYAATAIDEVRRARLVLGDAELPVATVFLGGGTPTFTEPAALARLLAGLPPAREVTIEANPETVTPALAALLREHGANRVSLGAQSFRPHLLATLERRATPEQVRDAVATLRAAGFDNVSLDLIYGIPGQSAADLAADLDDALALAPEHVSAYELEAKPGTRFTHAHGAELGRQAAAMEGYFEQVVAALSGAGYRWYETANFCRGDAGRDLRAHHNLGYWRGRDYLGVGIGAVSTVACVRWRNAPSLPRYVEALRRGDAPAREHEPLAALTRAQERVLLGLRLDEPLPTAGLEVALDREALARLERHGLVRVLDGGAALTLTERGRFLGGGVTAELLA